MLVYRTLKVVLVGFYNEILLQHTKTKTSNKVFTYIFFKLFKSYTFRFYILTLKITDCKKGALLDSYFIFLCKGFVLTCLRMA